MKKLYEKSEITFAIVWIVIYLVVMGPLRNLGDDSPWMMLGLIVISLVMFIFVWRNGLMKEYGLAGWAKNNKAMLWFIPLWLIACCNLVAGIAPGYKVPGLIFALVSMALVGFAEELIFRGFLFKAMLKNGSAKVAVIVCAVTFGLGHILNLFTGHALTETLIQVVYAITVGFVFTLAFYKGGSLLPCILAHSLTDVFAVLGNGEASFALNMAVHGVVLAVAVAYCVYLWKRVETHPSQRYGN